MLEGVIRLPSCIHFNLHSCLMDSVAGRKVETYSASSFARMVSPRAAVVRGLHRRTWDPRVEWHRPRSAKGGFPHPCLVET